MVASRVLSEVTHTLSTNPLNGALLDKPIYTFPTGYIFGIWVNNGERSASTIYGDGTQALIQYHMPNPRPVGRFHHRLYKKDLGFSNISGAKLQKFLETHQPKNVITLTVGGFTEDSETERCEIVETVAGAFPHMVIRESPIDSRPFINIDSVKIDPGEDSSAEQVADEIETLAWLLDRAYKLTRNSNQWSIRPKP
jgi:hypothetical protein